MHERIEVYLRLMICRIPFRVFFILMMFLLKKKIVIIHSFADSKEIVQFTPVKFKSKVQI